MEMATTLETGNENQPDPVIGSNIFWVILVLCITSAWHPLGSSIGFPDEIRRYVRIFPLTALFDTVLLYAEFVIQLFDKPQNTVRDAARTVAIERLRAAVRNDNGNGGSSSTTPDDSERRSRALLTNKLWLKALILFIGLDVRARLLSDILAVLLYAKMYGYYGTPVSFTIATLYFASWLANEMFLFLAYGIFWADNARELMDMVDEIVVVKNRPALSILESANQMLFLAQTIAFLVAGVWTVASRPHPESSSLSFSGILWAILKIYGTILRGVATPAEWWYDKTGETLEKYSTMGVVSQLLLMYPALFLFCAMTFVFLTLAVPMLITPWLILLSPYMFLVLIFRLMGLLLEVVREIFTRDLRRVSPIFWARAGCLLMLVAMVVYYVVLWDSNGTSKAGWTEHLG